ncbi:MCE family protein [Hymenobacter sp. BRD128]|uniref:MlaD family protein n=1 Tax=Hymenobacter sp. BRD128 TaxID=2675878 RepID=UPI0015670396|nr:MlaD family protein [Hymenobacter sp. BRD128]QKG55251.1 MCE family protein [Hymenobacter sp. BRD128]
MPQNSPGNTVRLGLFMVLGVGFLLAMLYLMGRQQSLFGRSLVVQADFRNVAGLLTGNSVRLGGIAVGNVKEIKLLNDSTVRVAMSLNKDAQAFVRQNAVASVGTDGLVGNTIINLTAQAAPAPPVEPGDVLRTKAPLGLDAMLGTLDISNKNLVVITQRLRQMATKLDTSAIWQLLSDKQLPANVRQSLGHVAAASTQLQRAAADAALLTQGVRQGRGPLGYLFTNKQLPAQLGHAGRQLARTTDTLAATVAGLRQQVLAGQGPAHTLLADTAAARQVRQSLHNVEQSTASFSQSMTALQHNFLLRGYFKKQARKKMQATTDSVARLGRL